MTRDEQKLAKAIMILTEAYKEALQHDFIIRPMAYALYHTWKYFNDNEKGRDYDGGNRRA